MAGVLAHDAGGERHLVNDAVGVGEQNADLAGRRVAGDHELGDADPGGRLLPASLEGLGFPASVDASWYRLAGLKVWVDSDVPMRGGAVTVPYAGGGGHGILNVTQPELDALALVGPDVGDVVERELAARGGAHLGSSGMP